MALVADRQDAAGFLGRLTIISLHWLTFQPISFSHRTWIGLPRSLPIFMASMAILACQQSGVAMTTASISFSFFSISL